MGHLTVCFTAWLPRLFALTICVLSISHRITLRNTTSSTNQAGFVFLDVGCKMSWQSWRRSTLQNRFFLFSVSVCPSWLFLWPFFKLIPSHQPFTVEESQYTCSSTYCCGGQVNSHPVSQQNQIIKLSTETSQTTSLSICRLSMFQTLLPDMPYCDIFTKKYA